jgi:hypothetical protein
VKHNVLVASLLLLGWCVSAALGWRLIIRGSVLSLTDQSMRSGLGILGLCVMLLLAYVPVNAVHRYLGGSGSFLRWALDVLHQAIGGR